MAMLNVFRHYGSVIRHFWGRELLYGAARAWARWPW
jgi:hypothetical protein